MAHDVSPVAMFIFIVSMQLLRMSNNLVTVDSLIDSDDMQEV